AHGAWLHVDAAMAGTAMACPELRWMWEGVEQADSVVWNPHKWLGIGFDCTAYHVRDPDHLVRVMATDPSYLRTAQDGAVKNYRDWGIALGGPFPAPGARAPARRPAGTWRSPGPSPRASTARPAGSGSRRCRCRPSPSATG